MVEFQHPYAWKAMVTRVLHSSGGLVPSVFVVTANISLNPHSIDYDVEKVDDLTIHAVHHAKRMGYPSIEFRSVS